jgi:hypothetical protein
MRSLVRTSSASNLVCSAMSCFVTSLFPAIIRTAPPVNTPTKKLNIMHKQRSYSRFYDAAFNVAMHIATHPRLPLLAIAPSVAPGLAPISRENCPMISRKPGPRLSMSFYFPGTPHAGYGSRRNSRKNSATDRYGVRVREVLSRPPSLER